MENNSNQTCIRERKGRQIINLEDGQMMTMGRTNVESDRVSVEITEYDGEMITYCNSDLGSNWEPDTSAFPSSVTY